MKIYKGNIVYSESINKLVGITDGYIIVDDNGIIQDVLNELPIEYKNHEVVDFKNDLIIPAFSDLHVHAPQYPNRGIAMDALLKDWLENYTFPLESRFSNEEFAREVYTKFVDDLIKYGTLHACVFATIHKDASDILVNLLEEKGIQSYVGKVNMDQNSPEELLETTEESVANTELFIKKHINNKYAKPIITPRFAPTCSFELLTKLGELSNKYKVGMQTHIEESIWERDEALKTLPGSKFDLDIYDKAGLLEQKPIICAHFIFPQPGDIDLAIRKDAFIVQCPDATTNVIAGIMNTSMHVMNNMNMGYGSDISAGSYLGIYRQVASSIRLSKIKAFYDHPIAWPITFTQAFYIATKGSGRVFDKVGSLEKGYYFDALVISGLKDSFYRLTPAELAERFCYSGDVSNISHRFLRGKEI